MGDLETGAVEGRLVHVPVREFDRVLARGGDAEARAAAFAAMARLNVLYMVARAGSGHLGSSFSSLDIVSWLHLEELGEGDVFFSSKGHDVPGLYATLIGLGRLPEDLLHRLRRKGGLPGHPDVGTPGIAVNTGSLGMGISKAKGLIHAARMQGRRARVVVMTGDGELQEGQLWESLAGAVAAKMTELTVVVDHNKLQSDTYVSDVSDLGDLEAKFDAFGWAVRRCDGHDLAALAKALQPDADRPLVVVADTVKGRGVSFMEHTGLARGELYQYHSGAPSDDDYARAADELVTTANRVLAELGEPALDLVATDAPTRVPGAAGAQRLVDAYSRAIVEAAAGDDRIVCLDGDLVRDVGLLELRSRFPDRFLECGIAEQDMVSMAGGLAAGGQLPFVHSFASFLSARPNEQIYNNATEGRKVVYVGSLAGVLPGGPGHSHQAVRDVSAVGGVPGLVVVQPASEAQVARAVAFCVEHAESCYLRLTTVPVDLACPPPDGPLRLGRGDVVRAGGRLVVLTAGPVTLAACDRALTASGVDATLVHLPFLNRVDPEWLLDLVGGAEHVATVDDHLVDGALGTLVGTAMAELGIRARLHRFGIRGVPSGGTPDEVLEAHGLDDAALGAALGALA